MIYNTVDNEVLFVSLAAIYFIYTNTIGTLQIAGGYLKSMLLI